MNSVLIVPIPPSAQEPILKTADKFDPLVIYLTIASLTCPLCSERVHFVSKTTGSGKEIKFFSHHPFKVPPTDDETLCPLRSASSSNTNFNRMAEATEKTLAHLSKFKIYLNKVFGNLPGSQEFQHENKLENLCREMNSKWYKKDGFKTAFCFQSLEEILSLFSMFVPFLKKYVPYLDERDHNYIYDHRHHSNTILIWECLHLFKEKSNLKALMKTTLLFLKDHSVEIGEDVTKRDSIEDVIIFWSFGLLFMMPWDALLLEK